jgi:hypothetical protein
MDEKDSKVAASENLVGAREVVTRGQYIYISLMDGCEVWKHVPEHTE